QLRDFLGLDKPLLVRYVQYLGHVATGDLGRSIQQNRPVADELREAWPATLELTVAALLLATVLGVAAGGDSPVRPHRLLDSRAWARSSASLCPCSGSGSCSSSCSRSGCPGSRWVAPARPRTSCCPRSRCRCRRWRWWPG